MKEKFKSYKFWLAVFGGLLIVVQAIAKENGIVITDEVGYNVINALCGALVFLGIIDKPKEQINQNNNNNKPKPQSAKQQQKTITNRTPKTTNTQETGIKKTNQQTQKRNNNT